LGDVVGELTTELGRPGEIRYGIAASEIGSTVDLAVLEDAPSDEPWPPPNLPDDLPMFRASPLALFPTAAFGNDPRMIAADIPAGAKVTARALARMYAGWLGEVDGVQLVSPERQAAAFTESSAGPDQVYGNDSRWSLGFGLGLPWDEAGSPRVFGMAGAGGSWAGADPDRQLAIAVTRNVMGMDFATVERVVGAVLAEVDRG
jgi:CubicO group peptidase (beta-lactamase class C family)